MHATVRYLGRRSGLPHTLAVEPEPAGDSFVIRVEDPSTTRWWRNFTTPWPLTLVDHGQTLHGNGEVVSAATGPAGLPTIFVKVCPYR